MKPDKPGGDRPLVEASANGLGVRVAESPCPAPPPGTRCSKDVHPDAARIVSPRPAKANAHGQSEFEGMSVSPNWRQMLDHRIPKRLNKYRKGAKGSNALVCWQMGTGDFVTSKVTEDLYLWPDKPTHGVVAPAAPIHVDDYQKHLESTVDEWDLIPEERAR